MQCKRNPRNDIKDNSLWENRASHCRTRLFELCSIHETVAFDERDLAWRPLDGAPGPIRLCGGLEASMTEHDLGVAKVQSLRIAVVSQYFYPEVFRVNDLVEELVERGHEVHVLTGQSNYPSGVFARGYGGLRPRRKQLLGANVVRVPLTARGSGSGVRLLINYLTFAVSATLLGPFLMRGRFDVVFTNQLSPVTVAAPGLAIACQKRATSVIWVQDLWPQTVFAMGVIKGSFLKRLTTKFTSFLYRGMDIVLVQSPAFRKPIEEQGVLPAQIEYVPNWAEDLYRPVSVPADAPERETMPDGFNVLFAGNLGEAQGLETLVKAIDLLRDFPDINWIILGDGRRLAWLREAVASAGVEHRVLLLGRKPVEAMPTWFALADVLLATLKSDPVFDSTIPSKLQSYLACGRPIVASMDGEGARVIEESGAGKTAAAGDAKALASAIRELFETTVEDRLNMSDHALTYYQDHFSRSEVISTIENVMTRDVARRREGLKT